MPLNPSLIPLFFLFCLIFQQPLFFQPPPISLNQPKASHLSIAFSFSLLIPLPLLLPLLSLRPSHPVLSDTLSQDSSMPPKTTVCAPLQKRCVCVVRREKERETWRQGGTTEGMEKEQMKTKGDEGKCTCDVIREKEKLKQKSVSKGEKCFPFIIIIIFFK